MDCLETAIIPSFLLLRIDVEYIYGFVMLEGL